MSPPRLLHALAAAFVLVSAAAAAAAVGLLGDRLIVDVNSVPYTQRQIEIYTTVKESLRKTPDGRVRLVDAGGWPDALQGFTEDMVVLQESQRLGSFQNADQLLGKYGASLKAKIAAQPALRAALSRLDANEQTRTRALESALRVAAFRHSKEHAPAAGGAHEAPSAAAGAGTTPRWLSDLLDRAVVRRYDGATEFQRIEPSDGRSGDAR